MDIAFLITTCNRQEACQRLVDSIKGMGRVFVYNDGGDYAINGAMNNVNHHNNGKKGYWRTVNRLFAMRKPSKYYIMIPDDCMITPAQVEKAVELWQGIHDPLKICLNLYTDRIGQNCWSNIMPTDIGAVYKTGWVDMCFLCEDRFFRLLGTIPEIIVNRRRHPNFSSGVGRHISITLIKEGFNMYQVKESLITFQPESEISQMKYYDNSRDSINTVKSRQPKKNNR